MTWINYHEDLQRKHESLDRILILENLVWTSLHADIITF